MLFFDLFSVCSLSFPGDSDFSADLHSFRYRKGFEIILIHNNQAKPALIQCANTALPFNKLAAGEAPANQKAASEKSGGQDGKKTESQQGSKSAKQSEKQTSVCKGSSGGHNFQMIKYKAANDDWYCTEHMNRSQKGAHTGKVHFKCQFCPRRLCDLCNSMREGQTKGAGQKKQDKAGSSKQQVQKQQAQTQACKGGPSGVHNMQMINYKASNDPWWCSEHMLPKDKGL